MTNITAKMAHSKESVELMCITQYNTFEFGKKIALLVISAALIVSTLAAENLSSFARWPLPFLTSPACIFLPISPPAWTSRL